jgi:type VI secretion system secreted protein Hcp
MVLSRLLIKTSAVLAASAGLLCLASTGALAYPHLTAESAAPIYMNCPDFTKGGDSSKGKGWIELQSFSFGSSNSSNIGSATGGAGAGKVKFNEFTIKKTTDSASPLFFKASTTGKHDNCIVEMDRGNTSEQQPYMTIIFSDVLISSYQSGGHGNSTVPTESITLNFAKIEYKNKVEHGATGETKGDGKIPASGVKPSPSPNPK